VWTKNSAARAMVPSGASTGVHEALELRDGGSRYMGKGVLKAVSNVNKTIAKKITGMDCFEQEEIDRLMIDFDGTGNKSHLGANAILSVSMAVSRLAASEEGIPLYQYIGKLSGNRKFILPVPSLNVLNGGVHAGNKLDIQEYMILPSGAKSFHEALEISAEVYHCLKAVIRDKYGKDATNVGDEGGFAPPLSRPEEPLDLIMTAVEKAGHEKAIKLGIDAAASEFFEKDKNGRTASRGNYLLEGVEHTPEKLLERYGGILKQYPIVSFEDVFSQDDWPSWSAFTAKYGKKVQVVGDDLLVTNVRRIKKAVKEKACNTLLLKINQIGSITESIEAANLSRRSGWNVMVSHRSGETEDRI